MFDRRTQLHHLVRLILLVALLTPMLLTSDVSGQAAPSDRRDSSALSEVVSDTQLEYKVFLPYLNNSHHWLSPFGLQSEMNITAKV